MTETLDRFDLTILNELQRDGRLTNAELAQRVGLSAAPCWRRVRALEAAGFILGYCIFGFVAGLVLLVLAVAVGGVLIVMKQRKGLHSKKSDNGIFIYAYSKKV